MPIWRGLSFSRAGAIGAVLLALSVLLSCGDDATGPGPVPSPTGFMVEAPERVGAGVPFELRVSAVGTGGQPLGSFSGPVALTVSAGTITPASVQLSAGTGMVEASITDAAGTVTIRAAASGVEGIRVLGVVAADRLLAGAPASPAGPAIPALPFKARAEDYSTTHPLLPGLPLSFNTLMLSFAPATTVVEANGVLQGLDAEIVGGIPGVSGAASGILFLRLESTTHEAMESALATLRASAHVDVAAQDVLLSTTALPKAGAAAAGWDWSATPGGGNWGMELVRAPQLWNLNGAVQKLLDKGQTQKPVTGVLDTGFASNHEDLTFEANQTPGVQSDHGTHVAGIIGARHDNGRGVEGINPFARMVVRANIVTASASFAEAFIWNFDQMVRARPDLRVVNISMAYNWYKLTSPPNMNTDTAVHRLAEEQGLAFRRMLEGLANSGHTLPAVTIAAGNDSNRSHGAQVALFASPMTNAALEPPFARNLIVVESDSLDLNQTPGQATRSLFSNPGGHVSGPGSQILSTVLASSGSYKIESGTSMAAPLVAGLIGYLYTLDPSLPPPTLQSNPALDLLLDSRVDVGGGARDRIDAFGAALALDRRNGNDRVLRMLLDVDDGTPDGNRRTDPASGAEYTGTDADGDGGIGDGRIDMRDFRRWRDAFLELKFGGIAGVLNLNGSATHPKRDLNGNGKTASEGDDESRYARVDFNGDGKVADHEARAFVGGSIQREVSDLEMLGQLFDDPHYKKADLVKLVESADIAVEPVKGNDEVQSIRSYVYRTEDNALVEQRIHTGDQRGEELHQVYTVPVEYRTEYRVRVLAFTASGGTAYDDSVKVTLAAGQDFFWAPEIVPPEPVRVSASPEAVGMRPDTTQQFRATVLNAVNTDVTWQVAREYLQGPFGTITASGLYTPPPVGPGESAINYVIATSVEDPTAVDTATVLVNMPPCFPTEDDSCGGGGSSWGDPHLITPDGLHYDFHAVGDFVLLRSTASGDPLEIHTRYRRPDAEQEFSWNEAVAMNVLGDVVEIHAGQPHTVNIYVNSYLVNHAPGENRLLPNGGVITRGTQSVTVSWPDGTVVDVRPSNVVRVLAWVKVNLPAARSGRVEGLLGNFDGSPGNDLRIRGGDVLVDPTPAVLYQDYRLSWRVPSASRLFTRGNDLFDPQFPPRVVRLSDLSPEAAARGRQVCMDAGVLDPRVLRACILDVVLTGDDSWAYVAVGVDPSVRGVTVNPRSRFMPQDASRAFGAIVTGDGNRLVHWSATDGSIQVDSDNRMTYTAPSIPGEYTITAVLASDPALHSSAAVLVTPFDFPADYTAVWLGDVDADWHRGANWLGGRKPSAIDNVFIPAGRPHQPVYDRSSARNATANDSIYDLLVQEGATLTLASGSVNDQHYALYALGDVIVEGEIVGAISTEDWNSGERLGALLLAGSESTLRGTISDVRVIGAVTLSGPTTITGDLRVASNTSRSAMLTPGGWSFTVHGNFSAEGFRMTNPSDRLIVNGNARLYWNNSFTAGEINLRGDFQVACRNDAFVSTGTRVVLDGTTPQKLIFEVATGCQSHFQNLDITNTAGIEVVHLNASGTRIVGDLTLAPGAALYGGGPVNLIGNLYAAPGSSVTLSRIRIAGALGTTAVEGHFAPNLLQMTGPATGVQQPLKPDLAYRNIVVSSRTRLIGPTLATGYVQVLNDNGLDGLLDFNGQTLTVTGDFITTNGGSGIQMMNPLDTLIVRGNVDFNSGNAASRLTDGLVRVMGNFRAATFPSAGTKVLLEGDTLQVMTIVSYSFLGTANAYFHDLEITNGAGVEMRRDNASQIRIAGDLTLAPGVALSGAGPVNLIGNLYAAPGSSVTLGQIRMAGALGTTAVEGDFAVDLLRMTGPATGVQQPLKPDLAYRNIVVSSRTRLIGPTLATGYVQVLNDNGLDGLLDFNGQTLTVTGDFVTTNGGSGIQMMNPLDTLIVRGNVDFNSGNAASRLTDGLVRVMGNFRAATFPSAGTKVLLEGDTLQVVTIVSYSFLGTANAYFHDLEITNRTGVELRRDGATLIRVQRHLDLVGRMTNPVGGNAQVFGTMYLRPTSVLINEGTLVVAACVKQAGHTISGTDPCT
jgi:formylmethanofuran dehydrogenase subunit C